MKKILICVTLSLLLALAGCTSSAAKKAMEEARLAVTNGEYAEALTYAKLAVKEGAKDEEFLSLFQILTDYSSIQDALSANDPDTAKEILDGITDFSGSGMAAAIRSVSEAADRMLEEAQKFDSDIEEIESDISNGWFYISYDEAEELLKETGLTLRQREKTENLLKQSEEGKSAKKAASSTVSSSTASSKSSSAQGGGKAMATKDEAVEIAREFLGISADAKYTYDVELVQDYYYVHFEVDYGEEDPDEIGCKVDALGFYAYDPAG